MTEKQDVATLFGNVQTKLKTYGLREYVPPHGLALSDLDMAWQRLLDKEAERSRQINAQIRMCVLIRFYTPPNTVFDLFLARIKETLRKMFAKLANEFESKLHDISTELTAIEGPLEVKIKVNSLSHLVL